MQGQPTIGDRLLLGFLLPVAVVVAGLHVLEVVRSGLAQVPIYAAPARDGRYPVVGGYRLETDDRATVLRPGDRLIRVGDRDLAGVGNVGFDAIALAAAGPRGEAPLVYERQGARYTTSLPAVPHPHPWMWLPSLILIPICVLVVRRAPGSREAQGFCAAFLTYAIVQAQFYGGPEWKSFASLWLRHAGTPVAVVLIIRFARLFPAEMPAERRVWWGWPWLAGALYLGVRVNYLTGAPLPPESVQSVSHACHAVYLVGTVSILTSNYFHASAIGRRRLKWVLWGAALGSAPLAATQLVPLLAPGWPGFELAFSIGTVATVFWVVGVVIAVVRYNAFDIDRLLGATAAYSSAAIAALGALLVSVPLLADIGSERFGIDGGTARIGLAVLLAAGTIPLGRRLRPHVDRLLFPERVSFANGVEALLQELSHCADAEAVFERTADRVVALLSPRGSALYVREGESLAKQRGQGLEVPERLDPDEPSLEGLLRARDGGEAAGAEVIFGLPFRRAGALVGLLLLGPKRSGDVYTPTDRTLLAAVSEKASSELLRFRSDEEALAMSRLLATASHDIRQPLHALGFMVESLGGKVDSDDARALVARIQRSTRDLSEMLSDLLDLSRLENGAMRVNRQRFALAPLLESLEAEFGPAAEEKGLRLRVEPSGAYVESDRLLLLRILRNLVSNAVRYTEKGDVTVRVRVEGERLWLEVSDTGPGIPESRQREIFEEFRQLGADPRASSGGVGLGLAIVERLAQLLDHALEVNSTPGVGSVFAVATRRATPAGGSPGGPAPASLSDPLAGRRIAVVDDDPSVLEATRELLASWGCEVRTATNAAQAEALVAADWAPEFVLSDYHLGELESGVEVIARMRHTAGASLPAALITVDTAPEHLERMRATGLPVLQKPLAPARLRALLSQGMAPPAPPAA